MKFKRVIALLLSLLLILSFPFSVSAASSAKRPKKSQGKSALDSMASFGEMWGTTGNIPGTNVSPVGAMGKKKTSDGKSIYTGGNTLEKHGHQATILDNKAAFESGDKNRKVTNIYNGKQKKAGDVKQNELENYLGTNKNKEDQFNQDVDEETEDDSLGMCGDAFESFTKAVNKFYATVKTLIEQVLPNPTDYIPRGWSWASKFAQAFGAIGISLCFIFWGIGYLKSNARFLRDRNFNTIMLPFVRAGVAAALSASAFGLVQNILEGGLSLVSTIAKTQLPGKNTGEMSLESMQKVANDIGSLGLKKLLLWVEIMLATVGVKLMMFVIVGFVIVKFFKMFIYAAVAPLPIASLAGENTQQHAFSYLKALLGVILECLVICMALELFLHGIFTPAGEPVKRLIPEISGETDNGEILMGYIENVLVWMFATTAIVFGSDRLVTKAFGN